MKRFIFALAIGLLIVGAFSCKRTENYNETSTAADTSGTSTAATDTSTTAATATTPLTDKDKDFVTSAGRDGKSEVELAQDALKNAANADVKAFAQHLVDDHTKANQELAQYASAHGVNLPSELEGKLKEAKERLMKLTGRNFDQAFVKQMIDDHTGAIKSFEDESKNGNDAELKSWVDKTLPTLRDHLKTAQDLQKKVGKK